MTDRGAHNVGCERDALRGAQCGWVPVKENRAKDKEKERDGSGITKKDPDPEAAPTVRDGSERASERNETSERSERSASAGCGGGCGGAATEREGAKG